jgi:hypothetical protein
MLNYGAKKLKVNYTERIRDEGRFKMQRFFALKEIMSSQ